MLAELQRQGVRTAGAAEPRFSPDAIAAFGELNSAVNMLLADRRGPVDVSQLNYAAVSSMAASLDDSHTVFLPPSIFNLQQRREAGNLGTTTGIRVEQVSAHPPVVVEVVPGSAGEDAGVRPGDEVLAIDGRNVDSLGMRDITHAFEAGDDGTHLALEIRRPGSVRLRTITVTRRTMALDLVHSVVLPGNVGYVRVREFSDRVPIHLQVEQALGDFRYDQTRGVILDLRGDPGGSLQELQFVLDDFVSQNPLAYVMGRDGVPQPLTRAGPFKFDQRLVVLVDGGSASSSELLASTVQEYHDGLIVGTRTCGCLMGALLIPLPPDNKAGMEIAVEKVLTPVQRRTVEKTGVTPDAVVPADPRLLADGRDPQLEAGIEALNVDPATARMATQATIASQP
jgi:carboxyl-terminal processing protease